jgi:hypothetical protein
MLVIVALLVGDRLCLLTKRVLGNTGSTSNSDKEPLI